MEKKKRNSIAFGLILVVIVALLIGFSGNGSQSEDETIKIGGVYPMSGPLAQIGNQYVEGAEFAAERINSKGGVNGKNVTIVVKDSKGDSTTGVNSFNQLVDVEGTDIVMGTMSNVMLPLIPLSEEKETMLFADASHPNLTGESDYSFRHAPAAPAISEKMVSNLSEEDVSTAGIFVPNSAYGLEFEKELKNNIKNKDSGIDLVSQKYSTNEKDFKTQTQKMLTSNPDIIYVIGTGNSLGILIKEIRDQGYEGKMFSDFGPAITPQSLEVAGDSAKGLYYTTYDQEMINEFNKMFREKYGKNSTGAFSFIGFGNVELITDAIESNGQSPENIMEYIESKESYQGSVEKMNIRGHNIIPPMDIVRV